MTKLLIHSNAPYAPTGYGNQVGLFAPLLAEHYDVAISSFYGLEGAPIIWKDIPVLPGLGGEFGNAYLVEHARNFFGDDPKAGIVMTLMDVWVLQAQVIQKLNACSWVPVDHDPAPPDVMRFFAESGSVPIAMSKFGEKNLEPFNPLYVPHGVDCDVYKPRPDAKKDLGWDEDAFVVGMVAANKGRPSRKCFQQAFEAFKFFREKHENAHLYLHTTMDPNIGQGEDLGQLLASLQIPEDAVQIANQYRLNFAPAGGESMSKLYSACDVLLSPSMGEGFGIPMLEAQSCGTPVIATDFSAMKEVVGAGWKVQCRPYWTGQRSWQAIPDVGDILKRLEEAYTMPTEQREKLSKKARRHALTYAAPKVVAEHFLPALQEVEERLLKPKAPSVPAKVIA